MEDVTDEVLGRDTETGEALRGELLDDKGKVIPKETAEAATPFMQEQRVRGKMRDGEFSYYDNGKLRVFRVNDPDFVRMLDMTASSHRFNPVADAMRAITRVGLAGVGGLMNPGFVFRAATHGQIAALITSPRWACLLYTSRCV